jgi:hypothetical protein
MKIIGVGLSKTGTTSLAEALDVLGFPCVHSAHPFLIESASALVDTPAAARYRELDILYPGSKFILTLRDRDSWLESCRKHWARVPLETADPTVRFEYLWCRARLFGRTDFDPENHWRAYVRHVDEVRRYFIARPSDILEINIIRGDGWGPLCQFLECPIPPVPFPWRNRAPPSQA